MMPCFLPLGAIYVKDNSTLSLDGDSSIFNNSADDGGEKRVEGQTWYFLPRIFFKFVALHR